MLNLRGHHILCMQFFQGYGYSTTFVASMKKIINEINSNPSLKIKLINTCDDICHNCPNLYKGKCQPERKSAEAGIAAKDQHILSLLELAEGKIITTEELMIKSKILLSIVKTERLSSLCNNCQWLTICEKCLSNYY